MTAATPSPKNGRPLAGIAVVVTRPRKQASAVVAQLRDAGARVVELPVIDIEGPGDGGTALRTALTTIDIYDWLVFTSANTVDRVLGSAPEVNLLRDVRIAAVGRSTATELERRNVQPQLVPPRYVAEALLEAFPSGPGRVLLPCAAQARDVLAEGLRTKGWVVDVVEAYRTVAQAVDAETLNAALAADVVTFTASSTVKAFVNLAAGRRVPPVVVCIGPVTAATATKHGLQVDAVATDHTAEGLVLAVVGEVRRRRTNSRT